MKKWIRKSLSLLLVLTGLFSITMFLKSQQEKTAGGNSYENALALATAGKTSQTEVPQPPTETPESGEPQWIVAPLEEEDPYVRTLAELNLEALRQVNPDVVGWILIPDTEMNYPLMQGTDNDYYLKHTWDRKRYVVGSIFLEYLCSPAFTDFNTIIYGHNMNDGSMFAGLRKYKEADYWKSHPYVYIRSDKGVYRYEIFSSYLAKVESNTYSLQFSGEQSRKNFLHNLLVQSAIDTGIQPETTDRVLTLSTCSGAGYTTRWVVHARLKMVQEQP